jgi:hypothetical protein
MGADATSGMSSSSTTHITRSWASTRSRTACLVPASIKVSFHSSLWAGTTGTKSDEWPKIYNQVTEAEDEVW